MKTPQSRLITLVAVAQFVPLVLFPWPLRVSSAVFIAILVLLAALLGWMLYRRKPWGITLTIFVQGMNTIVRIITLFPNVYTVDGGLDLAFLLTAIVSVGLSVIVLSSIDRPEIRLEFGYS
jgi:FtsH-binding integral membrane protein